MTNGGPNWAKGFASGPNLLVAVTAGALAVLFWDAAVNLWGRWGQQQELSHSYFIPFVSLWLVWTNRDRVKASIGEPSWVGAALIAVALLLLTLGRLISIFLFQHLGMVVAIAGLVALWGGRSLLRSVAAPILFLFFAVPPPFWVITVLSWKFQDISSILGVAMIRAMDIPVFLSGNIIDLGDFKLQVAQACSGLRYLFPFLSLGVIAAYMYRGPFWQRLAIVASTIPITIIMNSVRIAFTGAMVQAYGPDQAEGALHFFEGWVVFIFCLAALVGVIAVFSYFKKPRMNALDALSSPELPQVTPSKSKVSLTALWAASAFIALAFAGLLQVVTVKSLTYPPRETFASIVDEFPEWRHEALPIDPSVAEVLAADDTIVVDFDTPEGDYYNVYLAYLNAQRDGRSWHSPRQCIPAGGWKKLSEGVKKVELANGDVIHFNRLIIENSGARQLVYYWYDQRGRNIANEFVMKFWLIVDAVTRRRSDGALVRLITPIKPDMTPAEADAKLLGLVQKMDAILPAYVPN